MKIIIEFECDNAAFEDGCIYDGCIYSELRQVFHQAERKILNQLAREPATVCDTPEAADKLLDTNGNTIGKVVVER